MAKMYIKDENGNFVEIPAFKGDKGKSAYEQAKDGGYTGTEEEFVGLLNSLSNLSESFESLLVNQYGGFCAGLSARTTSGGSVGNNARSTSGGAVGNNAEAKVGGGAVGNSAVSDGGGGGAVGDNAYSYYGGGAVGDYARSENGGGAVGDNAYTTSGCAVGSHTVAKEGVAVGSGASTSPDGTLEAAVDAIQLGTGVNTSAKTLQVYDYRLMNEDGKIPIERLPKPSGSYSGSGATQNQTIAIGGVGNILLITSSNNDIAFAHPTGAHSFPNNGSDFSVKESNAKFADGVLTLTNNSYAGLNASGITYYYQVL